MSYWTDGKGDERILYVTTGYRLVALNAKTGALNRTDMNENIRTAIIRLNEAETLLHVEPFHHARSHGRTRR